MKQNSSLYILVTMGIVSALGPFVTDFYLPALPALAASFGTTASMVQLTLTVSMVGLAIGQLFIGPLSDRYGRKTPLILSLGLFVLSSLGCIYSQSVEQLLIFRFVQGLAGAGGVVISKSIATDIYQGRRLVRFFSILSSVQGLAPICAPVLGGVLLTVTDWRGIFMVLLALGVVLLLTMLNFRETLQTRQLDMSSTFRSYIPVLRNGKFMQYVMVQAMAMGVMFTYIASSPFIFQYHYGLSPVAFSLCFGLNALGIMAGSLLSTAFSAARQAMEWGARGLFAMSIVVATALVSNCSVVWVEIYIFMMLICLGLILPTSTSLSLELVRKNSGNASALLGFMTFFVGGICSPLAGMGNMLITSSSIIIICAMSTLLITNHKKRHTLKRLI